MKTKYNWVSVPRWVQYIAVDEDGQRYGYEKKPKYYAFGIWDKVSGLYCLLEDFTHCENWKDSLEERPKTLGTKEEIEHVIKMVLLGNGIDYETEVRFSNIASDCAEIIISRLGIKL